MLNNNAQWHKILGMAGVLGLSSVALGQGYLGPEYPQYVQYPPGTPPVSPGVAEPQVNLNADQIDQLTAPIALYPDPLLSLVFPAATYPSDVMAAEQWLLATPNPTEAAIDAQSWDASVKGLVHYPTVLKMMSDRIDWTQALGAAFLNQQQDVMDSIQRLRSQAQAAQNLKTTDQTQVIMDDSAIRIEPVNPDVLCVPTYDASLVYTTPALITWGVGFPIGLWCDFDFDWHRRCVVFGQGWFRGWQHPVAWDRSPPAWDRHPAGWVAAPKVWARTGNRPAPRITANVVTHLGLDRPRVPVAPGRGGAPVRRLPAPLPLGGGQPTAQPRNVFSGGQTRQQVQEAQQRARTVRTPVAPVPRPAAPRPVPPPPRPVTPAPRPVTPAPRPVTPVRPAPLTIVPVRPAPVAPRPAPTPQMHVEPVAPPRPAPTNAFGGGGGSVRTESARGHESIRR